MRDGVRAEYEKKVAAILNETGHPLRNDVMEELRAHLGELSEEEIAPNTLEELEELLGSPEEYAEILAPAPKPRVRWRNYWPHGAAAILLIVLALVLIANRHSLAAEYRHALGKNYYATPFFDMDRFQELKPGTTAEDIRNAIGLPIDRIQLKGQENEIFWKYSTKPTEHAPFHTMIQVVTDTDELRLIRRETSENLADEFPHSFGIQYPVSANVGSLEFSRGGENKLLLAPDSDRLYIITVGLRIEAESPLPDDIIAQWETDITTPWNDFPRQEISFVHLVSPRGNLNQAGLANQLKDLPKDSHVYSDTTMPFVFENRGRSVYERLMEVMVFFKGTLYRYPSAFGRTPEVERAVRDDQLWLIRHLLGY